MPKDAESGQVAWFEEEVGSQLRRRMSAERILPRISSAGFLSEFRLGFGAGYTPQERQEKKPLLETTGTFHISGIVRT